MSRIHLTSRARRSFHYLGNLAVLIVAVVLLTASFADDADFCRFSPDPPDDADGSNEAGKTQGQPADSTTDITTQQDGDTASRTVTVQDRAGKSTSSTTLVYTGPAGVAEIDVAGPGHYQVVRSSLGVDGLGHPRYAFTIDGVPVAPAGQSAPPPSVEIRYVVPPVTTPTAFTERVHHPDAGTDVLVEGVLTQTGSVASVLPSRSDRAGATSPKTSDTHWWWRSQLWFYGLAGDLTTEGCERFMALWQGGRYFVAVGVPSDVVATDGAGVLAMPFVDWADTVSSLSFIDYTRPMAERVVASVPYELDFLRLDLVRAVLPERDDWTWTAIAPEADPPAVCPSDLDAPAGEWELYSDLYLDFGGAAACDGCTLELYLCVEGSASPIVVPFGKSAYQGHGVTCLGPGPVRLRDSTGATPLALSGPGWTWVDPPERIEHHHSLSNIGAGTTVSVGLSSEQGIGWQLVGGSWDAPDPNQPIGSELVLQPGEHIDLWAVADVPATGTPLPGGGVLRDGPETVTITIAPVGDPEAAVWTTDVMWIGEWQPPPGAQTNWWTQVGSHAAGAHGSLWRTDLGILAPPAPAKATADVDVEVRLHADGVTMTEAFTIAGGEQLVLADVVGRLGFEGSGSLEVVGDAPVVVTSRTFNLVADDADCYPGGTYGQAFGSALAGQGLAAGGTAWLPQLAESAAYRSNIGLTNAGNAVAEVTVDLFDGAGAAVGSYDVTLQPGEWAQRGRPFDTVAGRDDIATGSARVTVTSGSGVMASASVIDNTTNDATTIDAERTALSEAWIQVASHANGAQGSVWRTDLGLLNPGGTAATVDIRLHAPGGAQTVQLVVPAAAQVVVADVLAQYPFEGSAALQVVSDEPVIATSRTYNLVAADADCVPGGTFGQPFGGVATAAGLAVGESAWIPQLAENDAFRSNLGLTNAGEDPAQVRVTLYDGTGAELIGYDVDLAPGGWNQQGRPFLNRAGRDDLDAGYARVEVLSGAAILASGSVVDNVTNDPTTIVAVTTTSDG